MRAYVSPGIRLFFDVINGAEPGNPETGVVVKGRDVRVLNAGGLAEQPTNGSRRSAW